MNDTSQTSCSEIAEQTKPSQSNNQLLCFRFPCQRKSTSHKNSKHHRRSSSPSSFGGEAARWRGGNSQQELCDAFESVALLQPHSQRKLPGNSRWIVTSPGWGHNIYSHETEQLIPDGSHKALFLLTACFLDQNTPSGEFVGEVIQGHSYVQTLPLSLLICHVIVSPSVSWFKLFLFSV